MCKHRKLKWSSVMHFKNTKCCNAPVVHNKRKTLIFTNGIELVVFIDFTIRREHLINARLKGLDAGLGFIPWKLFKTQSPLGMWKLRLYKRIKVNVNKLDYSLFSLLWSRVTRKEMKITGILLVTNFYLFKPLISIYISEMLGFGFFLFFSIFDVDKFN